jgi:uncharacterized membrane protein YgcG
LYYMLRQSLRTDICPQIQHQYQVKYAAQHHITVAAAHGQTTPCGAGHGAGFLFIPDLTDKASGIVLVVLILLYVGSQLGSTLVMSSAATMDPMQRRLMLFLPLLFVLFVFRFPAGVLVYWITTNFWTMGQQYVVRKRVGPRMAVAGAVVESTASPPGGKAKGTGPRSGPQETKKPGPRDTKALPKGSPTADKANGDTAAAGGIGGFFRSRLQPANQPEAATNGASNGTPSDASADTKPPPKSGSGTGPRSRSRSASGKSTGGSSKASGGSSKASGGSSKASGASAKGSDSSNGEGAKPPPPPRKRKKRSGRRR